MINVFQPALGQEEIDAVTEVVHSNWIGRGKKVAELEDAWARHIGVDKCISTTCATEGLFQAVKFFAGPGDEVVLPSISFVGALNAVVASGATPVFCDVDMYTLNPTIANIFDVITDKTRAVILLHYGGVPVDSLDYIALKLRNLGIALIEDCACAPASKYKGKACGTFGDVGIWSFDAMKIMSAGDGGMVYFKDDALTNRFALETYLGMTSASGLSSSSDRWWEFDVVLPGRRAIMNDITAAIALEQLKKLPGFIARRKEIWDMYNELLPKDCVLVPPPIPVNVESSYYTYWINTWDRDALAVWLRKLGIYTTFRYWPLHKDGVYNGLDYSNWAASQTLNLPLHNGLSDDDVSRICGSITWYFEGRGDE